MFESILCQITDYDPGVVESLIQLAVEIAREGREGRRIGTLFTLGDELEVLAKSRALILDPLEGHPESARQLSDPNLRGTIKELAQLDGAFVVSAAGVVVAACRYLDAASTAIDLPLGLGSRHIAAAHISSATRAVGVVVSESAVVRLFCHGSMIGEIIPELWMMKRYDLQAGSPLVKETIGDLAVITPRRRIVREKIKVTREGGET
jgi:diadenylate cyclase